MTTDDPIAFHPLCELWPLLDGEAFEELAINIAAHGLRMPILLYQGKILDGRNRYLACGSAGVDPVFVEANAKDDDEALELVWSLNHQRRHLTVTDKAFAAETYATLRRGRYQRNAGHKFPAEDMPSNPATIAEAAAKFDVGVSSIADARAVRTYAPELEAKVRKRVMSLRDAATKARSKDQPDPQAVDPTKPVSLSNPIRGNTTTVRRKTGDAVAIAPADRRNLTRQDVDPDFIGTELDFVREYGHVWVQTAEERATERFGALAAEIAAFARKGKAVPPVDPHWLRAPRRNDIAKLRTAVEEVEALIAEAKRLLVVADIANG